MRGVWGRKFLHELGVYGEAIKVKKAMEDRMRKNVIREWARVVKEEGSKLAIMQAIRERALAKRKTTPLLLTNHD